MANNIYLIQQGGKLQAMSEQPYNNEDILQKLLEDYPELLGGEEVDSDAPRRLLLISREYGVPGEENGSDRWSLDHLFIDQDGIPTLVEVKRSTDTRLRREVVGQMLDYAANAIVYWPVENIRSKFEAVCEKKGADPGQLVADFVGAEASDQAAVEAFWGLVKTNLQAGKVRLVFLADKIPTELQRIVEFLNAQMDPAEVIAVELRQFVGEGVRTLVPRVLGQTATATQKKTAGGSDRRQWDENSFFEELEKMGAESVAISRQLLQWIRPRVSRIWWGQGKEMGSFVPIVDVSGKKIHFFAVWTDGKVEIYFQYLQGKPPFDSEQKRIELMRRLNEIEGFNLADDQLTRRPTRPLTLLKEPRALEKFQKAIEWGLSEIRQVG